MTELTVDAKYALVRSVGEECISETELRNLLEKKPEVRCYDGFEPSGRMHIAQGIFKAINVNKCTAAGCKFVFWVADWFALMNDKMGGELAKIRTVGQYLVEVWTAAGMDMTNVEFRWSSDDINAHASEYWKRVIDIGRRNTLARIKKCCQIMGRTEGTLTAAQVLYPLMQCSDIFHLKADVCQLGLDQRKVNMLAREYCDSVGRKLKPVILSHHMMSGLIKGMGKMSKSNPDSAIFMEDSAEDVARKITAAYCPKVAQKESQVTEDGALVATDELNPVLDYVQCTAFAVPDGTFSADGRVFNSYSDVETEFVNGTLSETALKQGLVDHINRLLQPVRDHFASSPEAAKLLEDVRSFRTSAAAPAPQPDAPFVAPEVARCVAWLPVVLKLPLASAVAITDALNEFLSKHGDAAQAVLLLPDWSGYARSDVAGDEKVIDAVLSMYSELMRTYGLSDRVVIRRQSEVILGDANSYWLSVIAAGRKLKLDDVEAAVVTPSGCTAGHVIDALMRIGDVVSLQATHGIAIATSDAKVLGLAQTFTQGTFSPIAISVAFRPTLCDPTAEPTTADDWLFVDEGDMDLKRKLKRAYAAPNDANSTVAQMAGFFIARNGTLAVKRPADNGGDKDYTTAEALNADCASGALHPADLKAAVNPQLVKLTQPARDACARADMKKHATAVKNAEKKAAKK